MDRVACFCALLGAACALVVSCSRSDVPATTVTADELSDAYDANEVAADRKYKGKPVLVTGAVDRVEDGVTGMVVTISTSRGNVIADLRGTERDRAALLGRGQKASFRCTGGGKIVWPVLLDCLVVVDANDAAPTPSATAAALAGASADAGDSVGIKECDDYIKTWNDCYKKDPTMRAAAEPGFKQMKETWARQAKDPATKAALASGCKTALDNFPKRACK